MEPAQPPIHQSAQSSPEVITSQPKPNYLKTIIFSVLIIITLSLIAYLVFQNQKLQKQVLYQRVSPTNESPTPKTVSSISISPDETAGWKTYTNSIYGYSIKYPSLFTTQNLSSGAGSKEADSSTRNLFIYQSDVLEPYLERYINLEVFGTKPPYNQGTITEVILNNLTATKIVIPEAKFDIYSIQLNNKEFIEIYVSNDLTKKDLANQILSTFKFVDSEDTASVISINLTSCCPCPNKINKSQVGKNGWVIYENGKDYTSLLPKECSTIICQSCEPL